MNAVASLPTVEALRKHVLHLLCARDRLDPLQTPLHEAVIMRAGRPCGLFFQVEGPRLLRTCAIWVAEEHRILFYDSAGERFAEIRLSDEPDPRQLSGDSGTPQAA